MRTVAIRADASYDIGTGHVMRCLALAEGLRNSGSKPIFLSRNLPGNISNKVRESGFQLIELPPPPDSSARLSRRKNSTVADWLGVSWEQDVRDCQAALAGVDVDAYCVDHYALDRRWEEKMGHDRSFMIVLDDLADRLHQCHLLLDANLGRKKEDYVSLVDNGTSLLIGPDYALLRPEFAMWRKRSKERRIDGALNSVVVSMGGADKANVTGRIISAFAGMNFGPEFKLTVILGQSSPYVKQVRKMLENLDFQSSLKVNVSDMAATMSENDLAIGGVGGTAWERCCLALPSLLVVMAENQRAGAEALADVGAGILLGYDADFETEFKAAITKMQIRDNLRLMSTAAASIADGKGVERVCGIIASMNA